MATKKRPTDATLRNVRASTLRDKTLRLLIGKLVKDLIALTKRVDQLDGGSNTPGSEGV